MANHHHHHQHHHHDLDVVDPKLAAIRLGGVGLVARRLGVLAVTVGRTLGTFGGNLATILGVLVGADERLVGLLAHFGDRLGLATRIVLALVATRVATGFARPATLVGPCASKLHGHCARLARLVRVRQPRV